MKKTAILLILSVLLSGLTACGSWVRDDYLSVTPHSEQPYTEPAPTQEELPPTVSSRNELRGAVLSMIRDWTEHSIILVEDYDGDIAGDLTQTVQYATKEDPVGAYAVDYADAELTGDAVSGSIAINIVFRRSAAEISSIVTVNGNEGACDRILEVLSNCSPALTLRIRNYRDTDFASYIRAYCLEHPEQMLALPELSAQVYPEEGETRILELHFLYPDTREEMRIMQGSVDTILSSASNYIRAGKTNTDRASLLCRFLTTRFSYTVCEDEPVMPAYSLLCEGKAHSLSFASVFFAECRNADIDCRIISGTRNGTAHYWNMIRLDGQYYYVDLMRGIAREEYDLTLLTTQELEAEEYVWDHTELPETPIPSEESKQPTAPTEKPIEKPTSPSTSPTGNPSTEEPTEPTETTEATETAETQPTEKQKRKNNS